MVSARGRAGAAGDRADTEQKDVGPSGCRAGRAPPVSGL